MHGTTDPYENTTLDADALQLTTQHATPTLTEPGINIGAVSTYKIDPLKEDNWVAWSSRMNTILKFQSAYGHVQGTVPKPLDQAQLKNWEQRDLLAQILIKNNTSDEQMVHINQDSITMAAQMWQSLRAVHELRGQSGVMAAKHTFYGTRAPDDVNIPEHIAEMRRQQNKLHQMGCKIDDEEFKAVLVMSLPQSCTIADTYQEGFPFQM